MLYESILEISRCCTRDTTTRMLEVIRASAKTHKQEIALAAKLWDDHRRPFSDATVVAKGGKTKSFKG